MKFIKLVLILLALSGFSTAALAVSGPSKKCATRLEDLEIDVLRDVQFPQDEEQKDILKALKTKEQKVKQVLTYLEKHPEELKKQVQISMDFYNNRQLEEGRLPGLSLAKSPKTVDELIENYVEVGINQRDPGHSALTNVIANMRTVELYLRTEIEGGKTYKVAYTKLSPRILDHQLFELLFAELKDPERLPLYLPPPPPPVELEKP